MGTSVLVVTGAFAGLFVLIVLLDAFKSSRGSGSSDLSSGLSSGGSADHAPEVQREVDSLRRLGQAPESGALSPDDLSQGPFGRAKFLLKVQLFSRESRGGIELLDHENVVTRLLCEGLWACLVWDLGLAEATVSRAQLDSLCSRSGRSEDELWELALDNLTQDPVEGQELTLSETGEVGYLFMGNGSFVSSLAQRWEKLLPDASSEHGVLLSVPNWHALLVLPIGPQTKPALPKYLELLGGLFDYDDPVSGDVFWVREGTWTRLKRSGEALEFPPELAAFL